jgi:signal transduction histidine kinase
MPEPARDPARSRTTRLRSGQWLGVTAGALIAAALVGLLVSLVALHRLSQARDLVVDRVDPARVAAGELQTALLDEETGLRGYVLTGRESFLTPYRTGRAAQDRATRQLSQVALTGDVAGLDRALLAIAAGAGLWQAVYAQPAIAVVRRDGPRSRRLPSANQGRALFDAARAALATMDRDIARTRADGRRRLYRAAGAASVAALLAGALLVAAAFVASVTLRRVVAMPLARLARDARRVARGDLQHAVAAEGPRDIADLADDVEAMRRRVLAELEAVERARAVLEEQAVELQRSNAELEQFAYVASHDLQEPLRKVASFVGMLRRRYEGQLDERADQYIAYAVDGAERMQQLINDLLAFSRVGHGDAPRRDVDLDGALQEAVANLDEPIAATGARVDAEPLPHVRGDRSLLVALWQNLVANAVKFAGDEPPYVRISVRRDGALHHFTVEDNGIGVEPRHAERIFAIFQRLHGRDDYPGTGIGLALCRKIVEHHGGEMRLEPGGTLGGARFVFTLPADQLNASSSLGVPGPDSSDG